MSYVTGQANNLTDVLTALRTACGTAGWTLKGSVLTKSGLAMRMAVADSLLRVCGGTGVDGANNLVGASNAGDAAMGLALAKTAMTWPATYEIHTFTGPDEVYCLVNYGVTRYQWIAFGQSQNVQRNANGIWYGASACASGSAPSAVNAAGGTSTWGTSTRLFANEPGYDAYSNSAVIHGFAGFDDSEGNTAGAMMPLLRLQPNKWNGETSLLPYQAYLPVAEAKVRLVADLVHARQLRIDNYDPGQIIALGGDRWKVYPWYVKNASDRNANLSDAAATSGTFGWAIRYTGP